jgi:CheY-like chemotaxis protein
MRRGPSILYIYTMRKFSNFSFSFQMPYQNILLIDDDLDDREIFQAALEKTRLAVQCTALDNAIEALELLRSEQLNPQLIFLDLNMPVMNGQQFLVEIKNDERLSHIPVVILSTSSHRTTIELTKELGAMDFFSKPDKFEDLAGLLSSVLKQ